MKEEDIIQTWLDKEDSSWYLMSEIPVGEPHARKKMDVLLIEEFPFKSEEEMYRKARRELSGYRLNKTTNSFRPRQNKLQFILDHIDSASISIKMYEGKKKLTAESLGQIMIYRNIFSNTYEFDGRINIIECGIIFGEDHPTVRSVAESEDISLYYVCPKCVWAGRTDRMVNTSVALECPNCHRNYQGEIDAERILTLKNRFYKKYNISDKCVRFRAAALEYFGEEPSPTDPVGNISGATNKNLACAIAITRGECVAAVDEYLERFNSKTRLITELQSAFDELGLEDESGHTPSNLSAEKIGPTIPWVLAILSAIHDIDIEQAYEKYKQKSSQ